MSAISVRTTGSILAVLLASATLPAQTSISAESGMSKVRIVRLSEVRGAVQMDRATGRGFEAAMPNLPIVEQSRVRTSTGVAEIEFEDNSSLRVAPDSEVEFPQLERRASGATVTAVRLVRGMAYASLTKTQNAGNDFTLLFGPEKMLLPPGGHIRLKLTGTGASLAVLNGMVEVDGADGPIAVPRRRTINFAFASTSQPEEKNEIAAESLDAWDKQSADYHTRVAALTGVGTGPYSYGTNDLSYYGSFTDSGCGSMWRPYFASAAWDPYANGTWAWYSGAGYSWVSPYPWGWTPYHYGSWSYCDGSGWGWMPGGAWNGLANVPATTTGTIGSIRSLPHIPHRPNQPPGPGEPTLVAVSLRALVWSEANSGGSFLFRRDSAGLGIPREGLGGLSGFSQKALRQGAASTQVYFTAGSGAGAGRATAQGLAPVMIHRGSAPAPAFSSNTAFSSASSSLPSQSTSQSTLSPGAASSGHVGGAASAGGGGGGHPH
jgi:FecR protein